MKHFPFSWSARKNRHSQQSFAHRRAFRPAVEALEDRTLLSTLMVLNNADSGPGSLRDTIASAASGDTIAFSQALAGGTITLTSGQLDIAKNLEIHGLGAQKLTISGNFASRVFDVSGGVTVTIDGLTVADGAAPVGGGGGILNEIGTTLHLAHVIVTNNEGGFLGGGFHNSAAATATVTDCSFVNNRA